MSAEYNVYYIEWCDTCKTLVDSKKFNEERMECNDCHANRSDSYEQCGCSSCLTQLSLKYCWKSKTSSPESI